MNKVVTVTELIAFAKCEHKAELIQEGKKKNKKTFGEMSKAEKGIVTHAIIERKNKNV